MGGIISSLVSIIGALWLGIAGAWGMYSYLNAPVGWPNWQVKCCLVVNFSVHFPGAGELTAALAQDKTDKEEWAAALAKAQQVQEAQASAGASISKNDAAAQTKILVQTRTLIKEIPIYVTPAIDLKFPLSWAFVRLHDAAVSGLSAPPIPPASSPAGDTASTITASAAATTIATNYSSCRANAQQLTDIQALWAADAAANK